MMKPSATHHPRLTVDDQVMQAINAMFLAGVVTFRANMLAEHLWPDGRHHNAKGQVFHLGAAAAARLLRRCPAVFEREFRLWEILPHRLSASPCLAGARRPSAG